MNILYYCADSGSLMRDWQRVHIFNELDFHNIHFDIFNPFKFNSLDEANECLLDTLKNNKKYDLFLNCRFSNELYPSTMCEIQKLPIPSVLICFDNLQASYLHKKIMPYFDIVWLTSRENEMALTKEGINTLFLPYAANPVAFKPNVSEDLLRVCFIGTPYGTRISKINKLLINNIPCDIYYGNNNVNTSPVKVPTTSFYDLYENVKTPIGRKLIYSRLLAINKRQSLNNNHPCLTHRPSLDFEQMVKAYSDYALDLNITELRNTYLLKHPVYKLHLRSFEIPMCGGIEFTTYNEELASYFEADKEIVFYNSEEEYIEKARFYLNPKNRTIRNGIRVAARRRAENEHTWWNRFSVLFDRLGLLN